MKEIKYKLEEDGCCLTYCPYHRVDIMSPMVGSINCQDLCENFVSIDEKEQIVTCKGAEL